MSVFAIAAVKFNGTQYGGIYGYMSNRNRKVRKDGTSGNVHRTQITPIRTAPRATLRTSQLLTWVPALNDSTDILCKALDGANGLVMYGAQMNDAAPGYLGGTVHSSRTGLNGLLVADSIEWNASSPAAELAMSAYFKTTTPTVDPVSDVTNASLPAALIDTEALTLTNFTRGGGGTVSGISRVSLKIDHKTANDKDAECYVLGNPHPTDIVTAGANDCVDITCEVEALGITAAEAAAETWVLTFTQMGQGASLGTHGVTITLNNVYAHDEDQGSNSGQSQSKKIMGETRYDGTNKPAVWATF